MSRLILIWPRYQIVADHDGLAVVDTWRQRQIMATYGGSRRDRQKDARKAAAVAEYRAKRRVARLRRALISTGEISRRHADRLARHLDASGIGRWDHWFEQ